jgi:hypothetical protein
MRERPILFSGPMVRALLNGTKTQTRRVVKFTGPWEVSDLGATGGEWPMREDSDGDWYDAHCPYGIPGDRLWVRETWGLWDTLPCQGPEGAQVFYRATDDKRIDLRHQLWRPSIHMPRWASRLTLTITDVRVERLQKISEADAQAEGLVPWSKDGKLTKYGVADPDGMPGSDYPGTCPWREWRISPVDAYQRLWESINGVGSWDANPWVWVVSFTGTDAAARGEG